MRIVTRPDFDGIVCAVLLFEALEKDLSSKILWIEPGEIQGEKADIREGDILANLPWHPKSSLWFDHHVSNKPDQEFKGAFDIAPSAAGVVYEYYKALGKLTSRFDELVENTDMIDSADLTLDQVKTPENYPWVLLSMTIKNEGYKDIDYWNRLVSLLRTRPDEPPVQDPEVRRRCEGVIRENAEFTGHLKTHTRIHGQISVTDFRPLEVVPSGNRFLTYSLFPDTIASLKIRYKDKNKSQVLISIGRSIFNRNCRVNVGRLLARYGGGGHAGAGGCTLDAKGAQEKIDEILQVLMENQEG
ncbi:hypothetical protein [Desulfospira joergensenii]|uniref:hypothetical protein n=1 Tax=Desulfospira joergensenii TaxID=53329 RepID=UPI0003B7315D|nr:hypothetical protein [Desulfospira joergensenii]